MRQTFFVFTLFLSLISVTGVCRAQSSDASFPTPVFTNEISGTIVPRDIGDARRTRHFYTFKGGEGDVTVTVESADLNGDVDVFTASNLRPLLKFTLFGGAASKASKSVYLRKEELLILRVEARADGDTNGTYRISFSGAYAPAPAELARNSDTNATSTTAQPNADARRVTATGARLVRPPVEVPSLDNAAVDAAKKDETATETARANEPVKKRETATPRTRASNNRRAGTSKSKSRSVKPTPTGNTTSDETVAKETPAATDSNSTVDSSAVKTPAPSTTRNTKAARASRGARQPVKTTTSTTASSDSTATPAQATAGQRLVLITLSGEIIEREMILVRRVTIENNQVVVLLKDGKVIRQPLANVLRMSIEPR